MNTGFIQIVGPLTANTYIVKNGVVQSESNTLQGIVTKFSITSKPGHMFLIINSDGVGNTLTIGKDGILEVSDVRILTLQNLSNEGSDFKLDLFFDIAEDTVLKYRKKNIGKGYRPWQTVQQQIQ